MFSLLIIILLLINPKVTYSKNIKNDNFINIYVDSSKSINEHIKKHKIEINSLFNILNTWSVNNEVNINYFSFSDSISIIDNPTNIIYDSPSTDFSQLFNHIKSSPFNNNIIIISDGVKTYGYDEFNYKTNNIVHTIGLGENDKKYDVSLSKIEIVDDENDSLTFSFEFNTTGIIEKLSKNIFISNYKNTLLNIGNIEFTDNNYKVKSFTVDKSILTDNNNFIIEIDDNETNINNNYYFKDIDSNIIDNKNVVLLSGRLSSNTKYIKNDIISNISDITVHHFYRINDNWNTSLEKLVLSDYDMVIYDNYIPALTSYENLTTQIYFLNNFDISQNSFLAYFKCIYTNDSYDSEINKDTNMTFIIPPLLNNQVLVCENTISYYADNSTFISDSKYGTIIYSPNLYKLNEVSEKYKSNNSPSKFISEFIEKKIHQRYKGIDIYTLSDSYISKQNIDVYMNVNSDILHDNLYIEIIDDNNNTIKIDDYEKLNESLLIFETNLIDPGYYNVAGIYNDENVNHVSNKISVSINNENIEKNNVYIDEQFLNTIATANDGAYVKYDNVNNLLNTISFKTNYSKDTTSKNLSSYQFILFILIFLLLLEWYIRNKIGLV